MAHVPLVLLHRPALALVAGLVAVSCIPSVAGADEPPVTILEVNAIVEGPSLLDAFRRPAGLLVDPSRDLLFVGDTGNHRVAIFDGNWRCRGCISYQGTDQAGEPKAIAIDRRGRLFVIDALSPEIEVLSPRGSLIASFIPSLPPSVGEDARPQDVVIGPVSGRIFVVYGGERPGITILDPAGETLSTLGFVGKDEGILQSPVALAIDAEETHLAVADPLAKEQIHLFPLGAGEPRSFGRHGRAAGTLSIAVDVTWGPGETVWITDAIRHSIEIFDDQGSFLGSLGGFGPGPGQLNYPARCAFLSPDRLVVLERAGARFQVLTLDTSRIRQRGERVERVPPVPETEPGL